MKIGYVSRDAVDRYAVGRLSFPDGVHVVTEGLHEDLPAEIQAVVFGLDSFPPEERRGLLLELTRRPGSAVVGVHSYHLDEDEVRALKQAGVLVFGRLEESMFSRLAAADARRAA